MSQSRTSKKCHNELNTCYDIRHLLAFAKICCRYNGFLAASLCCIISSSWTGTSISASRVDSKISEFHDIPSLVVDAHCITELEVMLVPLTVDGIVNYIIHACINIDKQMLV